MTLICRFTPFDTWFFRESRPQGSIGSSELGSVFPPPLRTLLGAVRTAIGDAWHARHGTNWRQFAQLAELQALIGHADNLGNLRCRGPWLVKGEQRLYPAPATLMIKDSICFSLGLGDPVHCDLGRLHLPAFPERVAGLDNLAGAKPLGQCWLTAAGWQAVLAGRAPTPEQIVPASALFHEEPRLGIGRDNARSAVSHGLLYQTRHLRLLDDVAVELQLDGLADAALEPLNLPERQVIRLGGEGRQACLSLQRSQADTDLTPPGLPDSSPLLLYTLTPMPCAAGMPAGIPAGFQASQRNGIDVWEGEIACIGVRILSVACGRPLREGGWDMANHQSRPVQSLLPAGSALFVEALDGNPASLLALHNLICGPDAALGRGQLLLGRLPNLSTSGN
ncbi:type III-B CRISPR module-associated Cmr3 family protein [Pseudomonas sp. AN-1]|uniref:type III-B CRISPR module-associated Cmr3 family protein n=1 Tax=Pseudomonas sp. AN-1 TaxID=3096605 RepID=UPI002A6A962E|nr:type III-B CRISPR module-associated Cmr3 family protein [Pseudomonas sp. AN-1]WPP46925.1 type III-B CRISPR module-associated Cmr3 family protein [Pseudomonas sp. AN-1]